MCTLNHLKWFFAGKTDGQWQKEAAASEILSSLLAPYQQCFILLSGFINECKAFHSCIQNIIVLVFMDWEIKDGIMNAYSLPNVWKIPMIFTQKLETRVIWEYLCQNYCSPTTRLLLSWIKKTELMQGLRTHDKEVWSFNYSGMKN